MDNTITNIDDVRKKIDDYITTIHALQSFLSIVTWDDTISSKKEGIKASMGRRMETSNKNKVSPEEEITPDSIIQGNNNLGYVVEAKKSLPQNDAHWEGVVRQLIKYDDDLFGWWTTNGKIDVSCVVLLLEISRTSEFYKYLENKIGENGYDIDNPLSVVEFTKAPEVDEFIWLRVIWGSIEDEEVRDKLGPGKKVPTEKVVGSYGEKKFYDDRPPVEHTMIILWQDIFNERKSEVGYDDQKNAWVFEVKLEEITNDLQRLYGNHPKEDREVEFPKVSWVKEAMKILCELGYAKEDDGDYLVFFKRIRGDLMERFSSHRDFSSDDEDIEQLALFDNHT